jgi:hypothetical protein
MWSCNLAPNYSDLRPLSLFRRAVDKGDFLAEVEAVAREK